MKETIKLGLTLMVVTLIAALVLALTNYYTVQKIELQKGSAVKESLQKVILADSFKEMNGWFAAFDSEGNLVGRVAKVEVPGYSSVIEALVGVDLEARITGVDIVNQQETPGLGANIEKEEFLEQFRGKTMNMIKIKKDGGEIDAVTGATISSRAITDSIRSTVIGYTGEVDALTGATKNAQAKLNATN